MATGQVIGRHEVFEYSYRLGPAEERKRIKLVVIQRREQRRKSLIAAQKHFERTPVRLRVNLHRAQYGDPEVTSGSRQIPITLRRKVKPPPIATTRVQHGLPTPPATTHTHAPTITHTHAPSVIHTHTPHSPAPEPARIELVDRPVPPTPSDSGILDAGPDPVLVIPSASDPGHDSPPRAIVPSLSRSSSQTSINRPVTRSNSFGSSFRRFPNIMGLIRRNSKPTTPPSVVSGDPHTHGYFDHDPPRSSASDNMIVEERESELGSPVGAPAGHGPPSVTGSRVSRKPAPSIPESTGSGRSRTFSFGRRPSISGGSPRNKLIKARPSPLPPFI
ncbi:hypothetical protein FRC06_010960 [Ceratobasidium sp. 370]|nr:hypothetical protein FRC06_010960 [Ceratobasidium sp. 370]